MRPVVLDPRTSAAGFLDPDDEHAIYRLLGLLAFGRLCQYEALTAFAEESEIQRQIGVRGVGAPATGRIVPGQRAGVRLAETLEWARERRMILADRLPPETTPTDIVLASSVALHDEVKTVVDRRNTWANYDDPELGLRVRRVVGGITGMLVGDDDSDRRHINDEMLVTAAQAGAVLVTQSESLAPEEWEIYQRVAPGSRTPVPTMRLWTYLEREVNREPFHLQTHVPRELLKLALRTIPPSAPTA